MCVILSACQQYSQTPESYPITVLGWTPALQSTVALLLFHQGRIEPLYVARGHATHIDIEILINNRIQTERLRNIQDAQDTLLSCCSVFFSTCSSGYSSLNRWQRLSICDAPTFSTTYLAKQQTASGSRERRMPLLKPVMLFMYL